MRRVVVLLLAGMLLFGLTLNCKDAPKDQTTDEDSDALGIETLPPGDTLGDTMAGDTTQGGSVPLDMKANPTPDTLDQPEEKGQDDT